jgi:hypothetical protein
MEMEWKKPVTVFAFIGLIFPLVGQAGTLADLNQCKTRPLSDFLDAQAHESTFFPPVSDYAGWTDADFAYFALVDYAGLANEELNLSLGTRTSGTVLVCASDNGRVKVSVVLNTSKALGFAQSIEAIIANGFDFSTTPTIFGNKAVDVADGATPAVGPATLHTTFFIAHADDPLPNLVDALGAPDFAPWTLDFRSTTVGLLPDGTKARLTVQEVAATDENDAFVYSREIVDLNK